MVRLHHDREQIRIRIFVLVEVGAGALRARLLGSPEHQADGAARAEAEALEQQQHLPEGKRGWRVGGMVRELRNCGLGAACV